MQKRKGRKAQAPVIELVMLFGIGVVIFLGFLVFFSSYDSYFISVGKQTQLNAVMDGVAQDIATLAVKPGNGTVSETLQKSVMGEPYKIALNETGLYLFLSEYYSYSNLYNLNESLVFQPSSAWSTGGKITVIKEGNNIKLMG